MAKHVKPVTVADETDFDSPPSTSTKQKARQPSGRGRGRPRSATEAVAKAIYFRDSTQIDRLNDIVAKHPDSNMSRIIQQLVESFVTSYESTPPVDRKLTFQSAVYL
jgi:hypothetical protein